MHSNELAQNSPDIVFVMRYLRICKGGGLKPQWTGQGPIITATVSPARPEWAMGMSRWTYR